MNLLLLLRVILKAFIIFGTLFSGFTTADAGLPLIQISHDELGDDYPEMREEIHLEDFFWTGSGDGPPDYLKKVHTGISKGKEVVVKTETVVATVYVDGNNEIDIPICLDCFTNDGGGGAAGGGTGEEDGVMPPLNYSATDRRYWLLTVMSGFYSQKDNPLLEEKLARLYRLAFTRQQSKHLGINGAQQISGISIATIDKDGEENTAAAATKAPDDDVEILDMESGAKKFTNKTFEKYPIHNINSELATSSEETDPQPTGITTTALTEATSDEVTTEMFEVVTVRSWELVQENGMSGKQMTAALLKAQPVLQLQAQHPLLARNNVRILIHNITKITEDDVQSGNIAAAYDDDINAKIDERPIANQTELIYSVFVNGRPVLAVTAANDMKLVSETEAAAFIGKQVFMKAEPYLREPQATPLAPATRSGTAGFIDSIQNNTALVIVSSLAILLLLLLFVALLVMGRSRKRGKNIEVDRSSSRNDLLSESQSGRPISSGTMLDTGRSTTESRDVGIQNFSFESERGQRAGAVREPRIHFPRPPEHDSRRDSLTSTDNTSDSSVYCPINPPTADVQRILDDKAANLFEKHKRRQRHQYDRAEGRDDPVYTSVVSEQKRDKPRHKTKRRYLSENRVGSLETSPAQIRSISSGDEVTTDSIDGEGLRPNYENFERNEAFNPHNNYHRNKLLHQKSIFVDKESTNIDNEELHATEAINKEIIRALQPTERSSDTGSIGSFLSMASVKAFPKNTLPEPLNRVLEPVFVTYYDNVDNALKQTSAKSGKTRRKNTDSKDPHEGGNIATIERFPTPKAPVKSAHITSQSDHADPGVVGPIVWERHKKRLNDNLETDNRSYGKLEQPYSPIQDPAVMRNHYEGLLEGAIQMYSSQDDLPMPLPTRDVINNRKPTKREYRGSSAGVLSNSNKFYNADSRPATAQLEKTSRSNHSTQPPSPTSGAWGGGSIHGSHSPIVRPMSAGPFHRPEPLHANVTPKSAKQHDADLTAAPLIEAIQSELRKFKRENT